MSCLLVKIVDAMNLVRVIHGKRDPVKTLVANHTHKTTRMVRLASSSQNTIQNGFLAYTTLFQSVLRVSKDMLKTVE